MSAVCLSQETKTIFKAQNTSKQNLIELDSILFNHKYENLLTTDSIKALIFNEKENAIMLKPYEAYFNSEIEKSHSNYMMLIYGLITKISLIIMYVHGLIQILQEFMFQYNLLKTMIMVVV